MKPLVRRARGSYGFCLVVSNFVLPLRGLSDGVNELGWSLSRSWLTREGRIFGVIGAELRRSGPSRHHGRKSKSSGGGERNVAYALKQSRAVLLDVFDVPHSRLGSLGQKTPEFVFAVCQSLCA